MELPYPLGVICPGQDWLSGLTPPPTRVEVHQRNAENRRRNIATRAKFEHGAIYHVGTQLADATCVPKRIGNASKNNESPENDFPNLGAKCGLRIPEPELKDETDDEGEYYM